MANILAVGIATLDIINVVDTYPPENSEVRATSQKKVRGGNATNTLVVLSQLNHNCHWAGVSVDEADATVVQQELQQYSISSSACRIENKGKIPTSYITLNKQTGSRSIVHYRDCPEYSFDDFRQIDLSQFDWVHFEGRNIEQTRLMLDHLVTQYPHIPRSLEVEKTRPDIETLFNLATLLLFSKDYAIHRGFDSPHAFLTQIAHETTVPATCTWGERGAWLRTSKSEFTHHQPQLNRPVIDTLAAGDTFNAGMIHSLVNQADYEKALHFASSLASHKCQQTGLHDLLTSFSHR